MSGAHATPAASASTPDELPKIATASSTWTYRGTDATAPTPNRAASATGPGRAPDHTPNGAPRAIAVAAAASPGNTAVDVADSTRRITSRPCRSVHGHPSPGPTSAASGRVASTTSAGSRAPTAAAASNSKDAAIATRLTASPRVDRASSVRSRPATAARRRSRRGPGRCPRRPARPGSRRASHNRRPTPSSRSTISRTTRLPSSAGPRAAATPSAASVRWRHRTAAVGSPRRRAASTKPARSKASVARRASPSRSSHAAEPIARVDAANRNLATPGPSATGNQEGRAIQPASIAANRASFTIDHAANPSRNTGSTDSADSTTAGRRTRGGAERRTNAAKIPPMRAAAHHPTDRVHGPGSSSATGAPGRTAHDVPRSPVRVAPIRATTRAGSG
jgi:hypothetical protein